MPPLLPCLDVNSDLRTPSLFYLLGAPGKIVLFPDTVPASLTSPLCLLASFRQYRAVRMRFFPSLLAVAFMCVGFGSLPQSVFADRPLRPIETPPRASLPADTTCLAVAPGLRRRAPDTLVADHNLLDGAPATAGSTSVHAAVEIPAGTAEKWEVKADERALAIGQRDGWRRRIEYLPYPANYGFIPNTRSTPSGRVGGSRVVSWPEAPGTRYRRVSAYFFDRRSP